MSFETASALAVEFAWTGSSPDLTITIAATPYTVTIPTASRCRPVLGRSPSAWGGDPTLCVDFVRHVESAINTAVLASGRTFTLTIDVDTGLLTLAVDSGTFTLAWNALAGRYRTGLPAQTGVATIVGQWPPWGLVLLGSVYAVTRAPVNVGGEASTAGGDCFAFAGTATSFLLDAIADFIPRDPDLASAESCPWTALYPQAGYLDQVGAINAGRAWSLLDALEASRSKGVAFALSTWRDVYDSTTERYLVGGLRETLTPTLERRSPSHEMWWRWQLRGTILASGAEDTRA